MIPNDLPILKVSQVAEYIDISADRLRTYDEEYLVAPYRDSRKVRLYSNYDVEWIENLRTLIRKDRLSVFGFKEILRLLYYLSDKQFCSFVELQDKDSCWHTYAKMRKNPNYNKLKKYYTE